MKWTWIKINETLGHKKEKDHFKMINFSEKIVNNSKEIAENLCKYFSEEGSKLCHKAVKRSKSPPVPKLKPRHVTSDFLFTNCDENEINEIILRMKSQSCGVDDVSLKIVKAAKTIVIPILTHLTNLSLEERFYPERLKIARVLPLHKGKSKNDPINYRSISILPFF